MRTPRVRVVADDDRNAIVETATERLIVAVVVLAQPARIETILSVDIEEIIGAVNHSAGAVGENPRVGAFAAPRNTTHDVDDLHLVFLFGSKDRSI